MSDDEYLWQARGDHPYDRALDEDLRAITFIEGPSPDHDLYRVSCDPNDCSPGVSVEVRWARLLELRHAINKEEERRLREAFAIANGRR